MYTCLLSFCSYVKKTARVTRGWVMRAVLVFGYQFVRFQLNPET